jgi:hypothetical protein
MAVRAYKIVSGVRVERWFECGLFDLIQETDSSWNEIWRDCDMLTQRTRVLVPFASGPKGFVDMEVSVADTRLRHRKYFPAPEDFEEVPYLLDCSDVNNGGLPNDACAWSEVYQNGKKLPCEGYYINYTTATFVIEEVWRVMGAAYEVIFWANPFGGMTPQT